MTRRLGAVANAGEAAVDLVLRAMQQQQAQVHSRIGKDRQTGQVIDVFATAHGWSVGTFVYWNGTFWAAGRTDYLVSLAPTGVYTWGVVIQKLNPDAVRVAVSGYVTGLSGLTNGTVLYSSGAAGVLSTSRSPFPVLVGITATTAMILPRLGSEIEDPLRRMIAQAAHGFTSGTVLKGGGASWSKAQANSLTNAQWTGVVEDAYTTDYFRVVMSGWIESSNLALTPGTVYYLSRTTAGALTTTVTDRPVLYAHTATQAYVFSPNPERNAAPNKTQRFTASGSFVVPAGVHQVLLWLKGGGAGGGTGSGAGSDTGYPGGAGSPGAEKLVWANVVPGETITITIGAGGAVGAAGGNTSVAAPSWDVTPIAYGGNPGIGAAFLRKSDGGRGAIVSDDSASTKLISIGLPTGNGDCGRIIGGTKSGGNITSLDGYGGNYTDGTRINGVSGGNGGCGGDCGPLSTQTAAAGGDGLVQVHWFDGTL